MPRSVCRWNVSGFAVRNDELELHYQPRVSFLTGKSPAWKAHALESPEARSFVPDKFIHVAEDSGHGDHGDGCSSMRSSRLPIGVLRGRDLGPAVNLSPAQLVDGHG